MTDLLTHHCRHEGHRSHHITVFSPSRPKFLLQGVDLWIATRHLLPRCGVSSRDLWVVAVKLRLKATNAVFEWRMRRKQLFRCLSQPRPKKQMTRFLHTRTSHP